MQCGDGGGHEDWTTSPSCACAVALELLNEVVDETVVKVFSTKMRVTGSGLDLKDTSSIVRRDTSKVPPPKLKMRTFLSPETFLS